MEVLREFLETSTVHGLFHLSKAKSNFSKFLWTFIILFSFCLASFLIYNSFHNWDKSPITTSIHTESIASAPFPKVTVCPPKSTVAKCWSGWQWGFFFLILKNIKQTTPKPGVALQTLYCHDSILTLLCPLSSSSDRPNDSAKPKRLNIMWKEYMYLLFWF